jgi:hypothetical protein
MVDYDSTGCFFLVPFTYDTKKLDKTQQLICTMNKKHHEVKNNKAFKAFTTKEDQELNELLCNIGDWDSDYFPIVVDTVASKTITLLFTNLTNLQLFKSTLKGVGSGTITHVGVVCWQVSDTKSKEVILEDT